MDPAHARRLQQLDNEIAAARIHLQKATKLEKRKRGPENNPDTIRKRIKELEDEVAAAAVGASAPHGGTILGGSVTANPPPPPGGPGLVTLPTKPSTLLVNLPKVPEEPPALPPNPPAPPGYAKLLLELQKLLMSDSDFAKLEAIGNREMGEDLQVQAYMADAGFNRAALGDADYEDVDLHFKQFYLDRFAPREESYIPLTHETVEGIEIHELTGVQEEYREVLLTTLRFEADLRDISQLLGVFLDAVNTPTPQDRTPNQMRALLLAILRARADHRAFQKRIAIARDALHTAEGRMKMMTSLVARREELKRRTTQLSQLRSRNITGDGFGVGGALKLEIEMSELERELEDVKKMLANDGVAQVEEKGEPETEKPRKERARKGEGKSKENHVPLDKLTPEKQEEAKAAGCKEIGEYLRTGDEDKISFTTRRYAREDPDFLPELAHISYELARTCFKTERLNYVCRTHQRVRGKTPSDGHKGLIQGVGFKKELGHKTDPVIAPGGHMNCGCSIEHALFDFFWWKAVEIHSTNPEIAISYPGEKLRDDVIPCRTRSFMVEVFKKYTHLTLDDLFLNEPLDSVGYEVVLMARQLKSISQRLRILGHQVAVGMDGEVSIAPLEG